MYLIIDRKYRNRQSFYGDYDYDDDSPGSRVDIERLYVDAVGKSRLVDFLSTTGVDNSWNINKGDEESMLLIPEEEELRLSYQRSIVDSENKEIMDKVNAIKAGFIGSTSIK